MEEESIFSPRIKYTEHRNLTLAQAHHSHSLDLIPLSRPSPRTLAAVLEYLAAEVGLELVPRVYDMDTASPFRRTDIIRMILVYKAAQTFHLKSFIRWTPTLFQTTIKTSMKGATPKSVLELMNVKYLTLAHVKSHLQETEHEECFIVGCSNTCLSESWCGLW